MGIKLSFQIDGAVQISREIQLAVDHISDLKPFHKAAINIMAKRSDKIFKTKGKDIQHGPKWKPLSPVTKKLRKDRVGHYKKSPSRPSIMRWTGNLQKNTTKRATHVEGSFKHNAPYAYKLHKGSRKGNLPARKIQDLNEKTRQTMQKALRAKTKKDLGKFGKPF